MQLIQVAEAFISVTSMARTHADARARNDRVMPDFLPQWCEGQEKLPTPRIRAS